MAAPLAGLLPVASTPSNTLRLSTTRCAWAHAGWWIIGGVTPPPPGGMPPLPPPGGGPPPPGAKLSIDSELVKSTICPPLVKQAALFAVVRLATFPLLSRYVAPVPETNRRTTSQSSGHGFPDWGGRPSLHSFLLPLGVLPPFPRLSAAAERVTVSPGARSSAAGGA